MSQSNNILQELNDLQSTLADQAVQNVYTVPGGYFENLAEQVLNRIRANDAGAVSEELGYLSPVVNGISKQMPYSVPAGYFEGLEEKMLENVRISGKDLSAKDELETLSPLLSSLNKQTPYAVPDGYFEQLHTKPAAKVVSISARKLFRYAAAAVVTGFIVMAGFLIFNGSQDKAGRVLVRLERDVKKMNETEKDNLIEFIDAGFDGKETVQVTPGKTNEIKELLQGISDEELKDFSEQSEDIENVLMIN
jgi:hypothetical protein